MEHSQILKDKWTVKVDDRVEVYYDLEVIEELDRMDKELQTPYGRLYE